jgi:hypothetical protein
VVVEAKEAKPVRELAAQEAAHQAVEAARATEPTAAPVVEVVADQEQLAGPSCSAGCHELPQ